MKKLLIGLTLLASTSLYATDWMEYPTPFERVDVSETTESVTVIFKSEFKTNIRVFNQVNSDDILDYLWGATRSECRDVTPEGYDEPLEVEEYSIVDVECHWGLGKRGSYSATKIYNLCEVTTEVVCKKH